MQIFWRRFVFSSFFFSFEIQEHVNFFFLIHFSLSCQRMSFSSVPSALISASGSFSSHTRRPTGNRNRPEREDLSGEEGLRHSVFSMKQRDEG